jgi:hypothetical protein
MGLAISKYCVTYTGKSNIKVGGRVTDAWVGGEGGGWN